jgi:GrpB-like predicted nucleotidyltransferase (UPF0157 family)
MTGPDMTPMTEEQIRAAAVGEVRPLSGPIVLVDYDPEWPELFQREADKIRGALGDKALRIEHTGSTSVPELAAKPVIDIVLVVANSADEDAYVPALEAAGYELRVREPEWYEHRMLRPPDKSVHAHVFSPDCEEIDRMLIFRNRLRENESDRELYERAKRELAQRDWKFGQNYADAKSAVIDEILARARIAVDELTAQQLSALARVNDLLEQAGIAYWLFGGWAVDFYAGSVTRAHDDLDLAVWLEDLPRIAELLQDEGWRHAPFDYEDGGTGYERGAVRLEFTYLVRDGGGSVFTPLRHGRAAWPEAAFANDFGELRGVRSRLLGLAPLLQGKSSPRDDREEAAKDRADFRRLSGLERESPETRRFGST